MGTVNLDLIVTALFQFFVFVFVFCLNAINPRHTELGWGRSVSKADTVLQADTVPAVMVSLSLDVLSSTQLFL